MGRTFENGFETDSAGGLPGFRQGRLEARRITFAINA
jgi:hypothetical protein